MIRTHIRRRRLARRKAALLIARHGRDADGVARRWAIAAYGTPTELWVWQVVRRVERALGVHRLTSEMRRVAANG